MKTIYNTYVIMESQEQCDRMKQLCIDNGLKIWEYYSAFELQIESNQDKFMFNGTEFFITLLTPLDISEGCEEITEQEFIELLKQSK